MSTYSSNNKDIVPLLTTTDHPKTTQSKKHRYILFVVSIAVFVIVCIVLLVVLIDFEKDSSTINWEELFLNHITTEGADKNSLLFSSKPHRAGTVQNYKYALEVEHQLKELGFDTKITNYSNIFLSEYNGSFLYLLDNNTSDTVYEFNLSEAIIPEDSTSNTSYRHEAYIGYSPSGNVTGYVVYVNYGLMEDFDVLFNKLNFTFGESNNYIALARYGITSRGIKIQNAAKYGFKAMLLYEDPVRRGYVAGNVVPDGPWLPGSGIQRGSAQLSNICFGNPSPNRTQQRCGHEYQDLLPSIPVIPIGYDNTYRLMSEMNGIMVNETEFTQQWQGGMNLTYRINGNVLIQLITSTIYEPRIITEVKGFVKGSGITANESIVFGCHTDAWVYGTVNPVSGITSMIEIARAFSVLIKNGYKPKRSIYFICFDAEEFGLIGSTEFAETEETFVKQHLVVYFNQDSVSSGPNLGIANDPLMELLVKECMKKVAHPLHENNNLYDIWSQNRDSLDTDIIGGGGDYAAFVHEYGIPATSMWFIGGYGTYHSLYDSYYVMKQFIDPEFKYNQAIARLVGLIAFYIVDTDIIPFNTHNVYRRMLQFVGNVNDLAVQYNCSINTEFTDLLIDSIEFYGNVSLLFDERIEELINNKYLVDNYDDLVVYYSDGIRKLSSKFLFDSGLPMRPIYKNIIYGVDIENGYASQPLPFISYVVKYECNNGTKPIFDAYNITSQTIYNAAYHLQNYLL
eukprot:206447_1